MDVQAAQITRVDTTQQFPLGALFTVPGTSSGTLANQGKQTWIYVYNDSGGALAQGDVLIRKAATATYNVRKSPAAAGNSFQVVGVAQHAIANGSYGWVQRTGPNAEVTADTGGITADTGIKIGNAVAGCADAAAANEDCFGWSTETVAATAKATCFLDCRG